VLAQSRTNAISTATVTASSGSRAARARLGRVVLVVASLTAVAILWSRRGRPPPPVDFRPGVGARVPAPRPLRQLRIDLGTPSARAVLVRGFGDDERMGGRSVVRLVDSGGLIRVLLTPDPGGILLRMVGRSLHAPSTRVTIRLNGEDAGAVDLPGEWASRTVGLPEHLLFAGPNELELSAQADAIALEALVLTPTSGIGELDLRSTHARSALGSGWSLRATPEGQLHVKLKDSTAQAQVALRPTPNDYVLGLIGQADLGDPGPARTQIFVNRGGVGTVAFNAAVSGAAVVVPRDRLYAGDNRVDFARVSGPEITMTRVLLEPVTEDVWIDVGSARGRPFLGAGFSGDESFDGGDCAWSDGPVSEVRAFVRPVASDYRLSLRAHALGVVAPVDVEVRVNGRLLPRLSVGVDFGVHDVVIPQGTLTPGENRLELRYARTAQPRATMKGSEDARMLAVRYDWFEVAPVNGG
jgi:hypothetical protein